MYPEDILLIFALICCAIVVAILVMIIGEASGWWDVGMLRNPDCGDYAGSEC